jgi:DNA/RNA-binding domain of Phe-tRNA-synthetase-like protein
MSVGAQDWIDHSSVDQAIWDRWPAYRVVLVAVDHVDVEPLRPVAAQLLADAHHSVRTSDTGGPDAHTARWHDAFRDIGIKPRIARPSSDALVRRAASERGLPSIDVLVDLYNAISVLHRVPIGGEDLDRYDGWARLAPAAGDEPFHTTSDGEAIVDLPEPGRTGLAGRRWRHLPSVELAADHPHRHPRRHHPCRLHRRLARRPRSSGRARRRRAARRSAAGRDRPHHRPPRRRRKVTTC